MKSSAPLLAFVAGALAHGSLVPRQSPRSSEPETFRIRKRVGAGGKCGKDFGNAACDPGLCCSEGGVCGTGGEFCAAPACQLSAGPACDGNKAPKGADTSKTPRPQLGSLPVGVDITSCKVMGKVAITFDDGPYIYTSELLDLLKRNNVRATFFIVGNNGAKGMINDPSSGYIPIVQRMIADGHQVGSHSWSHQDLELSTPAQRRAQIINNEIAIADILGVIPTYFRPPYTSCESACYGALGELGYKVVNYDVDPKDWEFGGVNAKSIYQSAISQGSPANRAYLALAHDIQEFTVKDFAQFMIDKARAAGYELVTAGECLGDAPSNWYRDSVTGEGKALSGGPASPPPGKSSSTTASSTQSKTSSSPSSESKTSTSTPKPVAPGTDFGLGKSSVNSTSQRSSSSSSSSSLSPSSSTSGGPAPAQSSSPPASLGSRSTTPLGRGMFGGNELFALFLGLLGLLVFALN